MTMLATTDNSHAASIRWHSRASVVATGTWMVGSDILRSMAILLVMLVHLPLNATPGVMVTVREYGWLGVDFRSLHHRRAFRIFPAFFIVLTLYAPVPVLQDARSMQPLWKFVTFTGNHGFDPREGNAFSQAWTRAVEEQFYLVLPLLLCRNSRQ